MSGLLGALVLGLEAFSGTGVATMSIAPVTGIGSVGSGTGVGMAVAQEASSTQRAIAWFDTRLRRCSP